MGAITSLVTYFFGATIMDMFGSIKNKNVVARLFYYISFVMSRNPEPDYVDVSRKVLKTDEVLSAIEMSARQELDDLKETYDETLEDGHMLPLLMAKHRKRALNLIQKMKSCISSSLLRIAGWVIFRVLSKILTNIQFNKGQIEMLRKVRSSNRNPIIYLPIHRSHLDYILVSFILYMNNIKPPLIAAGDNLQIPLFGNLMRGLGAFFIRRKIDPKDGSRDHVYRAILEQYMTENLKSGESMEFFLEGGRSRSGKLMIPKTGLLSVIVNSVLENKVNDVSIVPVGVSYDKLIDGNFVPEQLGQPKVPESFSHTSRAIWSTLHSNFGSVRVDFCQPFSLKEYLRGVSDTMNRTDVSRDHTIDQSINDDLPLSKNCHPKAPCVACLAKAPGLRSISSCESIYGIDLIVDSEKRRIIQDLGEHVIHDATQGSALMSTHMLAFLLLTKYRKGVTVRKLVPAMNWLRDEVQKKKRDIGFVGETADAIRYAYNLLGRDLVKTEVVQMARSSSTLSVQSREDESSRVKKIVVLKPATKLPFILELQYYSNAVTSTFAMDGIVANSISALFDVGLDSLDDFETNNNYISRNDLFKNSLELSNLLKYEFILAPPCTSISDIVNEVIDGLIYTGVLKSTQEDQGKKRRHFLEFDEDGDGLLDEESNEQLTVSFEAETLERLQFYRGVISPFVESYWLAACALHKLIHQTKEYKIFFEEVQEFSRDQLRQGTLCFQESIASEPLKNSLSWFENQEVICRETLNGVSVVYLNDKFDEQEAIDRIILSIEKFKK